MKINLIFAALLAVAVSEGPAGFPGWHYLQIPARQETYPTPAEHDPTLYNQSKTNTTQQPRGTESDESQSQRLSDNGEYYVLLSDGRLQMVKYKTAPLRQNTDKQSETQQVRQAEPAQAAYYLQIPQSAPQYTPTQERYTNSQTEKKEQGAEDVSGYQANLQFRNVKPISAPIYAHNPNPLVRILKK